MTLLAPAIAIVAALLPAAAPVAADEPQEGPFGRASAGPAEEWTGRSVLRVRGACLDDGSTCAGEVSGAEGSFFLPAPAGGGSVVVSWRPVSDPLRVLRVTIAGLVLEGESPLRLPFHGLAAGEQGIRVEPARRVVGVHEQVVDWRATFALTAAPAAVQTRGQSTFTTGAGCLGVACDPLTRHTSDTMVVPWRSAGHLAADWDEREGPMRVSIPGTGFAAEGAPPLLLDLNGLEQGEWSVRVEPLGVAAPLRAVTIGWLVELVRA